MNDVIQIRRKVHNLWNFQALYSNNKTVKFETKTVTYRGNQIWKLIPDNIKNATYLEIFKKEIRKVER